MMKGASAAVGLPMPMNEYYASNSDISLIHHLFEAQVSQCPEAIALEAYKEIASDCQGEFLTYQALNDRANQLAHFLQSHGVKPDTPVGLCVDRSFDLVISVLAILKAGGAYLPLDPSYPVERLHYMLENAQAPLLLTQSHLLPHLPSGTISTICLDTEAQSITQLSTANPTSEVEVGHLAYVIYTSGSTGRPKAVAMPHAPLVNLIQWQQQSSITAGAKTLQFTPISFDVSFQEIFATLTTGGTLVLISDIRRRDPLELLKCLNQAQIARLFLPFVALQHLADAACDTGTIPTHLREVITAGEQLRITPAIAHWFSQMPDCTLHNHYGPSETHVVTAYTMQGAPSEWELLPPIGRVIANTEIYLLDPQLQPVPEGTAGEVYIGGLCLAREYLNRPDLTHQRFIANPLTTRSTERLYKTGDLACYLPDGNLKYLGRADQQVKIRGFRVELGEIEAVLEQHPAVQEAVAIAREDDSRQRLIAYVIVAPELTDDDIARLPKLLRQFLKTQLPDYMLPHSMMVLDQFPLTPSGKVDRLHLPIPQHQPEVESLTRPRTATEATLAQIWAGVLGLQHIGIDDDFLELGGHSLLATQVMSRIRDAFGVELSLRCLFDAPTVRQLAETIVAQQSSDTAPLQLEPVPRNTDLPLAYVQEPLWLLDQLMPSHPFYSVPEAFRIEGSLDVQALEQSFQAIVDRHEAVRTNFLIVDGKPVQVIRPSMSFHLNVVDLEPQAIAPSLPVTQQDTELGWLILEESRRPFDLTQDLLLRATLFSMSNTEHVLFINLHHIVCDGWSLSILLHELSTIYQNYVFHTSIALPALKIQYADFAVWNRQWLQDDIREQQLAYWKQKLAGLPPMLQLPTDYARPLTTRYRGARHFLSLSHQVSERLKQLSHQEGATLFMTLLGAFQTLLFHYSGQDDIAIGSLLANRHRPELEALIGFFANTIVLRTDLSGQPTFRELLQRVRETTLEAYAHQDLPFEQLVRSLQPDRDLNQNPLVQVVFNLQNTRTSAWGIPGVALTQLAIDNETVKFDLFLELAETPTGLTGYFEYSTDLFHADTIARLAEHFQILLDKIVANPDQKLSEFYLLTPTEQQQLCTWNQTQADIPSACMHQLFEAQVERTPNAIAVEFEGRSLTYRELNQRSNRLAHYLQTLGVKPETLVGICVERSLEMVIGLLGILKAGGAYVPLDPAYPQARLAFMLEDSEISVLLTQHGLVKKLPTHTAQIVCLDTHWEQIAIAPQENLDSGVTADHLAYTIYTSGSTGKPKGVQIEHRALTNFLHSMRQQPGLTAQDTLLAVTTISFDIAALELYLPLIVGARLVLVSREVASNATQLSRALQQSGATVMQATPATWRLLLAGGWQGNRSLKLLCGGEALPRELANQLLPRCQSLWNMYGPTETTIWSALHPVEPGDGPVVVGRAIANTHIYILNSHAHDVFNPVPIGVPGEVFIGGDGLARGYLNRPELTAERFIWGQLDGTATRLYKTGDLGRYRPDGTLEILGRVDHQVKIRGFRIELGDIEAALSQHSSIREAVVVAREDQPGDKRLVAYVVPKSTSEGMGSPTDIQASLQAEQLQQWQAIYNEAYSRTSSSNIADPTFNIGIWTSSYTGLPYEMEAMQEWVDRTVDRILSLRPNRVLEIGCGTGLLLFRIAPHCQDYLGFDLSEAAIQYVEQQLQRNPEQYSHVTLATRSADALGDIEPGTVDTVVLNSVIQYFPDVDYLVRVLETAVNLVKPGGSVFVGDVRCLSLLEAFHTSVQLYQASDELPLAQVQQLVRDHVAQETELLIDPSFFTALQDHLPTISQVELQLKHGQHQTEMTRFRYDVILHVGSKQDTLTVNPHVWDSGWTPAAIRQTLQHHQPEVLALTQVKNARIAADLEAMSMLSTLEASQTVAGLKAALVNREPTGIDPELLWSLGQEWAYHVSITWSEQVDCFDVVFQRSPTPTIQLKPSSAVPVRPWHSYSNNPLQNHSTSQIVQQLRSHLKEKLPEFMLPSAIVLMESLPQTPNGKVDRNALPAPHRESLNLRDFTAPRSDTEKQLAMIWEQVLGATRVGIHDNFFDLGGHSLLAAQVLAQIQRVFHIEFSLVNLFLAPTIGQLAPLIEERTAPTPTTLQPSPLDLRAEVVLDAAIRANGKAIAPTAQPANVLLTGASGFFGAFLLHELLQQTSANVYCLVRASDTETARQRLQRNLEHYSLWRSEQADRIIPVVGDLSKPYLGLAQETFRRLSATIDSIYHNGGLVNFIYPYPVLKAANVLGTEEVLRLAGQTRTKPVHFVSTVGVFSPIAYEHGQSIRSQDQPERLEGLYGYTQSKWVAEQLINQAQARGIPAAIYRPAWIEGHSQTGICNRADFVRSLIKGCIHMGLAPDWNMPMDIAPVDYISRAIVHLSQKPTSLGDAFNFSNPRSLMWTQLVEWMVQFGYSLKTVPYEQWLTAVRDQAQHPDHALHAFLPFLTEPLSGYPLSVPEIYFQTNAIHFDTQNIQAGLADINLVCPPLDDQLMTTYFSYFIRSGFLPPPDALQ
ncbi:MULTISPECIES: non-ribosomal peptide synthetase [unclassified Leptolyngbya]|uniref:non-ribosomal peptide synthetase n=1 Tax=unclassified Leptolyngbya TaxID=2650499 RepID=UPI00168A02AB|nr:MULTISPECIES: non-ribosomal peptide synthetase [unclassified Leptolyngbya]MBD1913465.1 amino acid adenylation domain-containing protein [Leptolyngbya sp. FACHB-8]MBD2156328.1 amino acid adenylation domain-containing protein [Leptolyngbya sp. FACHB-16]